MRLFHGVSVSKAEEIEERYNKKTVLDDCCTLLIDTHTYLTETVKIIIAHTRNIRIHIMPAKVFTTSNKPHFRVTKTICDTWCMFTGAI